MLVRRWSPPSSVPTTSLDNNTSFQAQRTCLRWCKVFISGLIAITFIIFCIIYPLQKENFFNEEYQRKQQDEYNQQQRLLFDTYIQDISNILLQINDKNITDNNKYILYIQTKTLMLLKNLEIKRKKDIILFLYEKKLLQN